MAEEQLDMFDRAPAQDRLAQAVAASLNSARFEEYEAFADYHPRSAQYVIYCRVSPLAAWQRCASGRSLGEAWRRAYLSTHPLVTFRDVTTDMRR